MTASPMNVVQEYRLPRRARDLGILCIALFGFAGVGSVAIALANSDGSFHDPALAAFILGAFWLGLTLFGVWELLAYRRHRLTVDKDCVRVSRVFGTRTIELANVTRAVWRLFHRHGGLTLHTADAHVTIWFIHYTPMERAELIEHFRSVLREEIQEGWKTFEGSLDRLALDVEQVRASLRRLVRFTAIGFAVAVPPMYAILIWRRLMEDPPITSWGMVAVLPLAVSGGMIAFIWWLSRMELADVQARPDA